jgi:hypothetical protein
MQGKTPTTTAVDESAVVGPFNRGEILDGTKVATTAIGLSFDGLQSERKELFVHAVIGLLTNTNPPPLADPHSGITPATEIQFKNAALEYFRGLPQWKDAEFAKGYVNTGGVSAKEIAFPEE